LDSPESVRNAAATRPTTESGAASRNELPHRERPQLLFAPAADPHAVPTQHQQHENTRQDTGAKQLIDRHFRHHTVQDQWQRGSKQQAEAACRGDEPEIESVRVTVVLQRRVQNCTQRNDRDARGAGKRGKKRTGRKSNERQAAGHPAEQCACHAHQPFWCIAFTKQVTGKGKQRDRRQKR
jgi:hypothetical protein